MKKFSFKKILAALSAAAIAVSFTACGNKADTNTDAASTDSNAKVYR